MARLTKTEIEQSLLAGKKIEWKDAAGKKSSIVLDSAKQRRLFAYLLSSKVREVKGIPEDCVKGLANAHAVLADKPETPPYVQTIWPVIGVLFERPS